MQEELSDMDIFKNISFIKSSATNEDAGKTYAPMFRRRFYIDREFSEAKLYVCGLGYAYSYLNGMSVSEDLFTAPFGNYNKTLWYNEYDVTSLLNKGENIFAAICGNGWYNEVLETPWDFDKANWRDTPKLIMCLVIDGKKVLCSDENFRVSLDSPVIYNQLRSGEHFDSRLYQADWNKLNFDDSEWENAINDTNEPKGVFRKCECEPIRACEIYPTKNMIQTGEKRYVFDLGQNISGFIKLDVCQKSGTVLKIGYAELLNEDNTRNLNKMDIDYFKKSEVETDYFICNGKRFTWSPMFTYHGFQYIEIDGIEDIANISVSGVFVHQDIEKRSEFHCSSNMLNQLFRCGQFSSYCNMFYMLTDCPTREKLGWANDARASTDQMLTNFKIEKLFAKWIVDVRDAMIEDGSLPGIIPTAGWGFEWGNGPVSDGLLFEIPYQIYLHTGDATLLKESLPSFRKYLAYLETRMDENGDIKFGLPDWAAPGEVTFLPVEFINDVLRADFLKVTALAAKLNGEDDNCCIEKRSRLVDKIRTKYIDKNGRCIYEEQTAVAMLIYYDFYTELEPLAKQLKELIEERNYHHNCGMVGLRHLYIALTKCGLSDDAFKIITIGDYPSQAYWVNNGANTLWEMWQLGMSRNHHMYSDFMSWTMKAILGIAPDEKYPGYKKVEIKPHFLDELTYAEGYIDTVNGRISVYWHREADGIILEITVPNNIKVMYQEVTLQAGKNIFQIQ